MAKVLLTGGTGLVGKRLSGRLAEKAYEVSVLSRNPSLADSKSVFLWDPARQWIDPEAVNSCDYIIHLAGLNIGAGRWTARRKQDILDSRIKTARLVYDALEPGDKKPKAFISASAIGYYGAVSEERVFVESDPPGKDFLGQTCRKWEAVTEPFAELGIRTVRIRMGIVLSKSAGALSRISFPIKFGLGAAIGTGKQYFPWIHPDDLCDIMIMSIENGQMEGAYNAVAPQHVTNKEFTLQVARSLKKPLWLPNVPSLAMKVIFGEKSDMLLHGSRISSGKITQAGFEFQYPTLEASLKEIYG